MYCQNQHLFFTYCHFQGVAVLEGLYEVSFKTFWYLLHTYCWVPVCSYQSLCSTTAHINHPYTAALTVCYKQAPERFFQCKTDA